MENHLRRNELMSSGFTCSQILLMMGLESMGKDNPDLIRSMHALAGGIGFTGYLCGALSGGACLLGLYAGKSEAEEEIDERLYVMLGDLVDWYKEEFGLKYGGIESPATRFSLKVVFPITPNDVRKSLTVYTKKLKITGGKWI